MDIEHVVPHPSDDTVALLQPSTSNPLLASETKILLFRPSSGIPYKTHTITFRLLNVIWYPTPSAPSSNFTLVGITQSWSVVLFGDDVQHPSDGGATPTQITLDSTVHSRKKTIFQEMFGISALTDLEPIPSSSSSSVPWIAREGKQSASAIFDAPAYLMPPLGSLFEPLIGTFLQLRSETQGLPAGSGKTEHPDDEEVEMDVDEENVGGNETPLIAGGRPERIVDAREMNDFVELFKCYGLTRQFRSNYLSV